MGKNRKIGIIGGAFDPIHNGHINIAQSAYKEYSLDEVWFIPAGHSPNKDEKNMTPAEIRAEMTALAIEEFPHFKMSRMELDSTHTSYTYLTLTKLKEQYPNDKLYFIMGADSLDYFEKWAHPEIICEKASILVAVRDELQLPQIEEKIKALQQIFCAEIFPLACERTDVSSTEIRESFSKNGGSANISDKVRQYIIQNKLYGIK